MVKVLFLLCFVAAMVPVGAYLIVKVNARHKNFVNAVNVPYNKVGLVLGTSPKMPSGKPNFYFTSRINAAATLYKSGKVSYLLVSGDNGSRNYDEPTAMRDALIAAGVPAKAIYLDYAGFRTLDSVVRAHNRNPETLQRLKALCKTTDGFRIAEEDLKLRGPGDFFGARQSGLPTFRVGQLQYDLQLLKDAQAASARWIEESGTSDTPEAEALRQRIGELFRRAEGTMN